jgi:hypothetical protein
MHDETKRKSDEYYTNDRREKALYFFVLAAVDKKKAIEKNMIFVRLYMTKRKEILVSNTRTIEERRHCTFLRWK